MIAYRYKNAGRQIARGKADEVILPSQFTHGRIVWVEGPDGREQRFCTGTNGELVSLEEHRKRRTETAAKNRLLHPFVSLSQSRNGHSYFA